MITFTITRARTPRDCATVLDRYNFGLRYLAGWAQHEGVCAGSLVASGLHRSIVARSAAREGTLFRSTATHAQVQRARPAAVFVIVRGCKAFGADA